MALERDVVVSRDPFSINDTLERGERLTKNGCGKSGRRWNGLPGTPTSCAGHNLCTPAMFTELAAEHIFIFDCRRSCWYRPRRMDWDHFEDAVQLSFAPYAVISF